MILERSKQLQALSIQRCCQLLELSRSEFYRPEAPEKEDELDLLVEEAALERPAYGYRRVAAELKRRGSPRASHKRVRRRMKRLGLSARRKKRKARTTTPGKAPASPNLAKDLKPKALRELLVTDLTYVALPQSFAYVSVVLDAYSRRALGWAVSDRLETELPLRALEQVFALHPLPKGWVHHSDRGSQYTSEEAFLATQGPGTLTTTRRWRASSRPTSTRKQAFKSLTLLPKCKRALRPS